MESSPTSSQRGTPSPDLSHSFGEVLSERAAIPEHAPRIKIGDEYYHVVRIVGGRYEAPISNPRELEKATRIGAAYFSAHKKHAEATPDLRGKKIEFANEKGILYDGGRFVRNDEVRVDAEDSMNYLKATDNFAWQQEVKDFEQHLGTLPPTHTFPNNRALPNFLYRYARSQGHGPYTIQQVKGFLLEYTKDRLLAAHEVFIQGHHDPERHREDIERALDREISTMGSATDVIDYRNNYFKAGYLRTNHLWKMMVGTLQPAEYRLLPEEEAFDPSLDRVSPHPRSAAIPIPVRSSSVDLSPHSPSVPPSHQHRRRAASFGHPSELSSMSPAHFRPISHEEQRGRPQPQHLVSPIPYSPSHLSPRLVSEERDHDHEVFSRGSTPPPLHSGSPILRPTPLRPGSTEPVSLLSQQVEEQRRREQSLSPSSMRSPVHSPTTPVRTQPFIPPLDLGGHQSSLHPHPVAIEVVDRAETGSPRESQIPTRERGHEVHSPHASSLMGEDWVEIDLSSRPSSPRPSSVVVPLMDPRSQSIDRRSPIPRGVQESSLRRPPRKLEFFEQEDFRARAELYPQLRLIASSPPEEHVWENRAATKAACRSAHQKMERNAGPVEYTPAERHALHQVIQKKESAGGFGLLMAGNKYQSVSKSLEFYAGIGLI